jgi:hypothetical protein
VRSANRHRLAFSLLTNDSPVDFSVTLAAQNEIGVLLAEAKL